MAKESSKTVLRARIPVAVLAVAALTATGQPSDHAVETVAHRAAADPVPGRGLSDAGDVAGAFTPILDPEDPEASDESQERDGSGRSGSADSQEPDEVASRRDRGWGSAERRAPVAARPRSGQLADAQLARLIEDVTAADGYRYGARDSAGSTMDTAKVIDKPGGGYLAVYHTGNVAKLATSTDLKTWRFRANLDPRASQPTIMATSDGGYLVALETETGNNGQIKLLHYRDLAALQTGRATRSFTAPRTLSSCNEGTPSITSAKLSPDLDHSVIELGMHYHRDCDTDREATARLTNFRQWKATPAPGTDSALTKAAATLGKKITGNIGDRDTLSYGGTRYSLNEVQLVKGQFGTWRTYLYDTTTGRARPLNITTHRGSRAFANPTISRITAPDGQPAILVALYLPVQGAAPGEAGELIYYRVLPRTQPSTQPSTERDAQRSQRAGGGRPISRRVDSESESVPGGPAPAADPDQDAGDEADPGEDW